jgi:amino-acid N-acetyltransferase
VNLQTHSPRPSDRPVVPVMGVAIAEQLELRRARAADVNAIHALIDAHLHEGHLLPRTREDIEREVEQFVVATRDDVVVGCAELSRLATDVAEVRSLVVADDVQGRGIGRALVLVLMAAAQNGPYTRLCAFTHAPAFFVRLGFSIVPHLEVPEKVFTDCVGCALFRRCGQQAVVCWLDDDAHGGSCTELEW